MEQLEPHTVSVMPSRVGDLCRILMQFCSPMSDAGSKLAYFRNLHKITSEICELQKDLTINRPRLSKKRSAQMKCLHDKYIQCCDLPVTICTSNEDNFGLQAACFIETNTQVLHIPLKYVFSTERVSIPLPSFLKKDPLFSGMDNAALSIAILHELSLGEESKWRQYVASLPQSYTTVAYLTEDELSLLEGFPVADTLVDAYKNICRQYAYFYLLFEQMKKRTVLPNYMNMFCFDDFRWAVSTVMSRNNQLPLYDCGDDDGGNNLGSGGGGGDKILCLVPLWDMLNHRLGQISTTYEPITRQVVFYSMESYKPGDEIFMDYGKRTSAEFFMYNGFVPDTNPYHKVSIKLGLNASDKFKPMRTKILDLFGMQSEFCLSVSPQETFPPHKMTVFARVFVMTEDELKMALDELSSTNGSSHAIALLSATMSSSRVNEEAKRFIEGRLKLLIRGYQCRLEKKLKGTTSASLVHDHCVRLCHHDINALSECLANFSHGDSSLFSYL